MRSVITAVRFDFERKIESSIPLGSLTDAIRDGYFCWIDIDGSSASDHEEAARKTDELLQLLHVNEMARREVIGPDREGRYDVYEDCLHFAVTEGSICDGRLRTAHLDVLVSGSFLVTYRRKPVELIGRIRRTYREDFIKFAKTPGFLIYELADHLTEMYRRALQALAEEVERVQIELYGEVDDSIFKRVSTTMTDLLALRKVVTASRELFHELATRRSPFVSETTQPFLENIAGTLERLSEDLRTEREVLNEMLNLYMGMVSHRTNKVINRLTVISAIFLPLSFICGVYGVNLKGVPEFEWEHGYLFFWILVLSISTTLLIYMRRKKWL
ncbi:MAG: magnesium transporter CorA family protein [Kiritimatiellae bacterium]|nr:magnesium transporter CorA family protein [Kiritimatiellia bacterium]MDW8459101.1 magnesium transporter CorA family protein [Verrucomicrobiota bacterium]